MSRNADELKPYAFSFAVKIHNRDNQMSFRGTLVKHQKFYLYLQTLPEDNISISISKTALLIQENVVKKSRHLSKNTFFKFFDNVSRIFTGLKFSFISSLPFYARV